MPTPSALPPLPQTLQDLDGMTAQMGAAGVDLGALEATPAEDLDAEATEEATA